MRRLLIGSLVLTTLAVLPLAVTAQNKNDKKPKTTQATDKDYALLARYSQVNGKVVSADAGKITISIDHPHAAQNTSNNSRTRRPNNNNVQHDLLEFELPVKEKAVVKKMYVSMGFDEKGNPKTSASADDKTKKPASAPGGGYACELSDLIPGTVVRLQLGAAKKSATATKKDDDTDTLATHPTVTSVTALSEPKEQVASDNGKKKKNQ